MNVFILVDCMKFDEWEDFFLPTALSSGEKAVFTDPSSSALQTYED